MDNVTLFEGRFAVRLRAFARSGVQPVDSAAVARAAAVGQPKSAATRPGQSGLLDNVRRTLPGAVSGPWWTRPTLRTAFAAGAVVAVLIVGGAFVIGRPSPTPSADPSPSSGLVVPGPTPSATAPNPPAFPRQEGVWIATGSMGTPRSRHIAVRLLDGRVLVAGGANNNEADRTAELYDPNSGTWSVTGNMLQSRFGEATLLRDGRVLVGPQVFDPAAGTWSASGKMVGGGGAVTLLGDGRVLVTGSDGSELFNPDRGTWTATGKMINPRHSHAAILLPDGRVLVAGGHAPGDEPTDAAELYDPATGSWTATANMNGRKGTIAATLLRDGTVLAMGGQGSPQSAELYDPVTGAWTVTGDVPGPGISFGASATLLSDGRVLVRSFDIADLYDPGTGSWTTTGRMLQTHRSPVVLLLDGTVLAAGGDTCLDVECVATGASELYVPAGVTPPSGLPTST